MLEAMRQMRSALGLDKGKETASQIVMLSSAVSGEGKSTIAANLAVICAQAGIRTLLIDADIRKGTMQAAFQLPRSTWPDRRDAPHYRMA
jgi:tyrosine-protein kinase Etk/Wzc